MTAKCVVDTSSILEACAKNIVTAFPKNVILYLILSFVVCNRRLTQGCNKVKSSYNFFTKAS